MSIFVLKVIAVFFMVVDHLKYAFPFCVNSFTLYFGRIAFPIFAFCAVQGYLHTHDFIKYIKRLLIAGLISEIPYLLFNSLPTLQVMNLNIMFTLSMGLVAIKAYEYYGGNWKGWLAVLAVGVIAEIGQVDYGIFGVLLIFSFFIFKDSKWKTLLASFTVVSRKIFISNFNPKNWFYRISNQKLDLYKHTATNHIIVQRKKRTRSKMVLLHILSTTSIDFMATFALCGEFVEFIRRLNPEDFQNLRDFCFVIREDVDCYCYANSCSESL